MTMDVQNDVEGVGFCNFGCLPGIVSLFIRVIEEELALRSRRVFHVQFDVAKIVDDVIFSVFRFDEHGTINFTARGDLFKRANRIEATVREQLIGTVGPFHRRHLNTQTTSPKLLARSFCATMGR